MKEIQLKSFAKINLFLDVKGLLPSGYHELEMVMHHIDLHDKFKLSIEEQGDETLIGSNSKTLPLGADNICYKATEIFKKKFNLTATVKIFIEKEIAEKAGLAGGSGNGAATLLALDHLYGTRLPLQELLEMGASLGSDVPFSMMGQIKAHEFIRKELREDESISYCCLARGRGTVLEAIDPIKASLILVVPPISCSSREIYEAYDIEGDADHPSLEKFLQGLKAKDFLKMGESGGNVLEKIVEKKYPSIVYTKNKLAPLWRSSFVGMTGSGPGLFALYEDQKKAQEAYEEIRKEFPDAYLGKTIQRTGVIKTK